MKTILASVVFLLLGGVAQAGELRYVVQTRSQFGLVETYYLWANRQSFESCHRASAEALRSGVKDLQQYDNHPNVVRFCETGVAGMKPKLGVLKVGIQTELLEGMCPDDLYSCAYRTSIN